MIGSFRNVGREFRGSAPGSEISALLERLDLVTAFLHFVAAEAPVDFLPLLRDCDDLCARLHVAGRLWAPSADPGEELGRILEAVRAQVKENPPYYMPTPGERAAAAGREAVVKRLLELWENFKAIEKKGD
jgi:hypothetical protein